MKTHWHQSNTRTWNSSPDRDDQASAPSLPCGEVDRSRTYLFKVGEWARSEIGLPTHFVGRVLAESKKAVYVHGRGPSVPMNVCMQCGRKLTHPVSVLVGIGPECGGHHWDESVLGPYGMTEEHVERLKRMVRDIRVDAWVPKRQIRQMEPTDDAVELPEEHPMLVKKSDPKTAERAAPTGNPKTAARTKTEIVIRFPYDPKLVAGVKGISGRRWNSEKKWWTTPLTYESVEWCERNGFELSAGLQAWIDEVRNPKAVVVESLPEGLYPFQEEGVRWLEGRKGRGLIGDDMGLGKTVQALVWMGLNRGERLPAVVVCPASVKWNWKREAARWLSGAKVAVLNGAKPGPLPRADVYVINYDILRHWQKEFFTLPALRPQTVIYDEAHYTKNPKAKRTKAVRDLCLNVPHVIALSGTPITNRPVEFFPTLNLLAPEVFPHFFRYAQRYCNAHETKWGWDFTGSSNVEELHRKLSGTVMLRRRKADVLAELPPKVRTVVPLDCGEGMRAYQEEHALLVRWLKDLKEQARAGDEQAEREAKAGAMTMFERLKQAAVRTKLEAATDWIKDYLETEEKLVVFAHHKLTVDALMEALAAYSPVKVDGGTSMQVRQECVDRFQSDPTCRVFVGTMAAKEGITLTAAHATAFVELWWTPGDHNQAEDRVHRIGQQHDSVSAYYLVAMGTVEDKIATLLDDKRKVLTQVLDGRSAEDFDLLTVLMESMLEEAA